MCGAMVKKFLVHGMRVPGKVDEEDGASSTLGPDVSYSLRKANIQACTVL